MKVAWFSLESLGAMVRRCRADDSVTKVVGRILRAELIVVDDIGLLPVTPDAAEGLYRLVDAAYERRSVAISSNLHPSGFDELMPKTLATATVDRLMHHAHICVTTGDSIRLAQATTGQGVKALADTATPPPAPRPRHPGEEPSMPEPQTPWRNDGVTIAACAACGSAFDRRGRGRFCSSACRQAAWRWQHKAELAAPPKTHPTLSVIYECTSCDTRYVDERRCPDATCSIAGSAWEATAPAATSQSQYQT